MTRSGPEQLPRRWQTVEAAQSFRTLVRCRDVAAEHRRHDDRSLIRIEHREDDAWTRAGHQTVIAFDHLLNEPRRVP